MASSDHPLKYSHLDVAGSSGGLPHPTTGAGVTALVMQFLANWSHAKRNYSLPLNLLDFLLLFIFDEIYDLITFVFSKLRILTNGF